MDQNTSEGRGEVLGPVYEGEDGNLSNLVEGVVVVIDAVDGNSLGGRVSISGEAGTSGEVGKDFGSDMELEEGIVVVVDEGTRDRWGRSCIVEGQP